MTQPLALTDQRGVYQAPCPREKEITDSPSSPHHQLQPYLDTAAVEVKPQLCRRPHWCALRCCLFPAPGLSLG